MVQWPNEFPANAHTGWMSEVEKTPRGESWNYPRHNGHLRGGEYVPFSHPKTHHLLYTKNITSITAMGLIYRGHLEAQHVELTKVLEATLGELGTSTLYGLRFFCRFLLAVCVDKIPRPSQYQLRIMKTTKTMGKTVNRRFDGFLEGLGMYITICK